MTATAHALVSAAIVASVPNPAIGLTLAFTSHFIMDVIPHWDFGTNWRSRSKAATGIIAVIDTIIGFTVTYFLFRGKVPSALLFAAMSLGNLPDWMEAPYYIFFASQKKEKLEDNASLWEKITYRIYKIENVFHTKAQFPFGFITQIATVIFFFSLLSPLQ